jgi:hypothetical protein
MSRGSTRSGKAARVRPSGTIDGRSLQTVDAEIHLCGQERLFEFLHEQPLVTNGGEGDIEDAVAAGRNHAQLHLEAGMRGAQGIGDQG